MLLGQPEPILCPIRRGDFGTWNKVFNGANSTK